jgi:hypothetical protein
LGFENQKIRLKYLKKGRETGKEKHEIKKKYQ